MSDPNREKCYELIAQAEAEAKASHEELENARMELIHRKTECELWRELAKKTRQMLQQLIEEDQTPQPQVFESIAQDTVELKLQELKNLVEDVEKPVAYKKGKQLSYDELDTNLAETLKLIKNKINEITKTNVNKEIQKAISEQGLKIAQELAKKDTTKYKKSLAVQKETQDIIDSVFALHGGGNNKKKSVWCRDCKKYHNIKYCKRCGEYH